MKVFPRSVWIYALVLAVATTLPYVAGVISTPLGWAYSGSPAVPVGVQVDYNSHLAKMWQGSRGQWDYQLLFTHESHPGLYFVQGFYVALGALANITPFTLPFIYHIARFIFTVTMVLAIWAFAARFFYRSSERWFALLFGTIVGGWSWLLLMLDPALATSTSPIEFWLTDAFSLLGALYMPHFAAAVTLQIVIVLVFDDWVRLKLAEHNRSRGLLVVLTLALAAEAIIQPYVILLLLPLLAVLTAYHIFSSRNLAWTRAGWLLIPFGVHASIVVYQYVAISSDSVWAYFSAQNLTLSPLVTYYLLGYLPFLIPIMLGVRRFMIEDSDDRWWIPILWVAFVAMLLYAPFPTQRRYLLGVQTPLAVLAAYGWSRTILPRLRRQRRPLLSIVYFVLASVALVGMIAANFLSMSQPLNNPEIYARPDELAAYLWMRDANPSGDDLVFTTFDLSAKGSGGRLVAWTGSPVFIGHWYETAEFSTKVSQVERFYTLSTSDEWRRDFLHRINAAYVWYDDDARATGGWNPADAAFLEPVFATDTVTIFRFLSES